MPGGWRAVGGGRAVPACKELVCDADSLFTALKRLHATNDGVLFWNEQRSLQLMLRNDPVDAETLSCELVLIFEVEDEKMQRLLDLTNDGFFDEPGVYVLDSWTFQMNEFTPHAARKVMDAVNSAYLYRVCPCASYLVKDDGAICVFCHMTSKAEDRTPHFCSICCEDGMAMHMRRQACCQQHMHSHCLATWLAKSGDDRCPLCRQPNCV